jgi:hypothetical protein
VVYRAFKSVLKMRTQRVNMPVQRNGQDPRPAPGRRGRCPISGLLFDPKECGYGEDEFFVEGRALSYVLKGEGLPTVAGMPFPKPKRPL